MAPTVTSAPSSGPGARIDWGVAGCALGGAEVSGDLHMVVAHASGMLVGVADGLGHGAEAAVAAQAAARIFASHPGLPVDQLMVLCHEALRRTRGAVLSIASFDITAGSVEWVGVGNVEGILIRGEAGPRARESLLLRGGVVGSRIPPLRAVTLRVDAGDTLIFATDGIGRQFVTTLPDDRSPQDLADDILRDHGKDTDDALVLVVRYRGAPP
ncbi:MAG: rsbX [Rhodospirillales bacterium]|nr:rsbX [Rhodospirillales bacterium]